MAETLRESVEARRDLLMKGTMSQREAEREALRKPRRELLDWADQNINEVGVWHARDAVQLATNFGDCLDAMETLDNLRQLVEGPNG